MTFLWFCVWHCLQISWLIYLQRSFSVFISFLLLLKLAWQRSALSMTVHNASNMSDIISSQLTLWWICQIWQSQKLQLTTAGFFHFHFSMLQSQQFYKSSPDKMFSSIWHIQQAIKWHGHCSPSIDSRYDTMLLCLSCASTATCHSSHKHTTMNYANCSHVIKTELQ